MAPSESEPPWIHNRSLEGIPNPITIDSSSPGTALVGQIRLDRGLELGPHPLDLRRIHTHRHGQTPAFGHGFVQDLHVAIEPARAGPVARVEVELHDDAG